MENVKEESMGKVDILRNQIDQVEDQKNEHSLKMKESVKHENVEMVDSIKK